MTTLLLILVAALLLLCAPTMTNLTAATPRQYRGPDKRTISTIDAGTGVPLYAGAMVEEDSNGQAQNLTAAGTTFVGVALMSATAQGDRMEIADRVEVLLTIAKGSAISRTDVGATVYAGDGGSDFNLTSTSRQAIGKVAEVPISSVGSNTAPMWVYIEGQSKRSI